MFGQLRAIVGRVPRVKLITGTPRCWCLQPDLGMAQNDSLKSLRTDGVRKLGCKWDIVSCNDVIWWDIHIVFAALLAHALSKFLRLKYSAASVSQFHTAWTSFSRNHLCAAKHWPAKTTRSTMFGQLRAIAGRVPRVKLITGTPRCWCLQPDLGMAQNDSLKSLRTDGVRKLGCKWDIVSCNHVIWWGYTYYVYIT